MVKNKTNIKKMYTTKIL